jgi:hypothetical protein
MCSFIAAGATFFRGAGKTSLAAFGKLEEVESSSSIDLTFKTLHNLAVIESLQVNF